MQRLLSAIYTGIVRVVYFLFTGCQSYVFIVYVMMIVDTGQGQSVIPFDTTYTVQSTYKKLIRDYPQIEVALPIFSDKVEEHRDVVYVTLRDTPWGIRKLHADIFMPSSNDRIFPALLLIHGGGWRSGNKSMNTPMAQQLAARGFVVVSVEYRLSMEAKYPAAVHDVKAAIRWMRKYAERYRIDAAHIAIGGCSAGGQLASLVGATNHIKMFEGSLGYHNYSSAVQAVINMDGLLDFTNAENLQVKRTEKSADVSWLEGFYEDIPDRWKEASAITWVNKETPPFLFINSAQTRFHSGCNETVDKLKLYGIYSEVRKFEDAPHSFWLFHPWFGPTVNYMAVFLNKVFTTQSDH